MQILSEFLLIALPIAASPLIYLSGRLGNTKSKEKAPFILTLMALFISWVPFVQAARGVMEQKSLGMAFGSLNLEMDGLSLLLAAIVLALGTLVSIFSGPYMRAEAGHEKYYAMLTAMIGVMIGLGCASDLFNLWIWFEAMAVTSYLLVAFYREQAPSLEAGIKYLVQSAVGSVLVLLGISLVLAATGTLDLGEVQARAAANSTPLLLAAGVLFIIGFGVKTALVPLHTWLPDAHSQAPSGISAMLSGVVIEAGLVAMLRPLTALAGISLLWGPVLMVFGAINMLVGNLLALQQKQVKRMLAYSSLVHIGYMLIGIGVAFYAGDSGGAQGSLFHMVNHGLMKGLAFLAAGSLLYCLHIAVGDHAPLTRDDLAGASKRYPIAAFAFSIALLSLAGLPPLAGFMSKWQIFVAGVGTHNLWITILVAFAALNSVLSLAYYAPLINSLFRTQPSSAVEAGHRIPTIMRIPLLILTAAIVVIGIWPVLLEWLTGPAGNALLIAMGR